MNGLKQPVVSKENLLTGAKGKYNNAAFDEPTTKPYKCIGFGNTGLRLEDSSYGWGMDFLPEGNVMAATEGDKIVLNSYLFAWGMEGLKRWYETESEEKQIKFVTQDTNERMHRFRK